MPSRNMSLKVVGVLFLVSMIAYEICGYPASVSLEDFDPDLQAIIEELKRQGLVGRMVTRARGPLNEIIRKSVSPSDFRLRFGKRSMSMVPAEVYMDATRQLRRQHVRSSNNLGTNQKISTHVAE